VTAARRGGPPTAIAIIDLDRFKEVNDALGHQNGDHLLTELAHRLATYMRPKDCVARLGGDEFGIILRDVADPAEILWRIRAVIEFEVSVSGLPLSVDSSIGYVVAPADGTDVDELLQRADVAMYVAKEQHSGVVRYRPEQNHYDATNWSCTTSRRPTWPRARSTPSRHWSAGAIRRSACCTRTISCRSSNRPT
jgi:diguanylate cyclase (GGDEF)-like protein